MARPSVDKKDKIIPGGLGLSVEEWSKVTSLAESNKLTKSAMCRELVLAGLSGNKPSAGSMLDFIKQEKDIANLNEAATAYNKSLVEIAGIATLVGLDKIIEDIRRYQQPA